MDYLATEREQTEQISTIIDGADTHTEILATNGCAFNVWSLGIVIVIGGNFFIWNEGQSVGFFTLFLTTFISGTAYICLVFCIGEILSGLPFSGGAYGLVRCTVGFYPGFLVACAELAYYIVYTSLSICALSSMACTVLIIPLKYRLLICLVFYLVSLSFLVLGKSPSFFWRFSNILGIGCIFLVFFFCLGIFASPSKFIKPFAADKQDSILSFLDLFPRSTWFFVGIETLSFSCNMISSPRKTIAKSFIACMSTLFVLSMLVVSLCSLSQLPALLASEPFPLNMGFMALFNCSYTQATALSMPATFATSYGFTFCAGKLLYSLAESRMLPNVNCLYKFGGEERMPYMAMIVGSVIGYCLCFPIYQIPFFHRMLINFCFISAYITYFAYCVGYVCLKKKFTSIKYSFHSPLGIIGAMYAIVVFLFGIVTVAFFQKDNYFALSSLILLWVCCSIYYVAVAKDAQELSKEEQETLFIAHVVNFKSRRILQTHKKVKTWKRTFEPFTALNKRSGLVLSSNNMLQEEKVPESLDASPKVHLIYVKNAAKPKEHQGVKVSPVKGEQSHIERPHHPHLHRLQTILQNEKQTAILRNEASKKFCAENLDFCNCVMAYQRRVEKISNKWPHSADGYHASILHADVLQIINTFIALNSPSQINISSTHQAHILQFRCFQAFSALHLQDKLTLFDEATKEAQKLLCDNVLNDVSAVMTHMLSCV